jgi:hypothetical protein
MQYISDDLRLSMVFIGEYSERVGWRGCLLSLTSGCIRWTVLRSFPLGDRNILAFMIIPQSWSVPWTAPRWICGQGVTVASTSSASVSDWRRVAGKTGEMAFGKSSTHSNRTPVITRGGNPAPWWCCCALGISRLKSPSVLDSFGFSVRSIPQETPVKIFEPQPSYKRSPITLLEALSKAKDSR